MKKLKDKKLQFMGAIGNITIKRYMGFDQENPFCGEKRMDY